MLKSTPGTSVKRNDGSVRIHHHVSHTMYLPLVNDLMANRREGDSTCILTQTNEEAVILVALLRKHGLNSKLVQSMDGLRFWNLAEVRMFLKLINSCSHTPLIADDAWERAKQSTFATYAGSSSLQYLQKCLSLFEQTNKAKYLNDFKEFVFESCIEDFYDFSGTDIVVSTIHKAKGREFDDVYMLISNPVNIGNELLRRYYVGATRARNRLSVHTDSSIFDSMPADEHHVCRELFDMPSDVILQLSHKDVNLGFFKTRKNEILALRAGQELRFENNYLYDCKTNTALAQLSQKMQRELLRWTEKGYQVAFASIRFIVAWRPKDAPKEEKEHAVLLIDLALKRLTNTSEQL